jgi:ferredoxin
MSNGAKPETDREHRVRVDAIACDAHGMCAELLPERIALDEWGYPLIADPALRADLLTLARQAAAACPTRALILERPSLSVVRTKRAHRK